MDASIRAKQYVIDCMMRHAVKQGNTGFSDTVQTCIQISLSDEFVQNSPLREYFAGQIQKWYAVEEIIPESEVEGFEIPLDKDDLDSEITMLLSEDDDSNESLYRPRVDSLTYPSMPDFRTESPIGPMMTLTSIDDIDWNSMAFKV